MTNSSTPRWQRQLCWQRQILTAQSLSLFPHRHSAATVNSMKKATREKKRCITQSPSELILLCSAVHPCTKNKNYWTTSSQGGVASHHIRQCICPTSTQLRCWVSLVKIYWELEINQRQWWSRWRGIFGGTVRNSTCVTVGGSESHSGKQAWRLRADSLSWRWHGAALLPQWENFSLKHTFQKRGASGSSLLMSGWASEHCGSLQTSLLRR